MDYQRQNTPRGMNVRNNGLGQQLDTARAVQNLIQNSEGHWVTRPGSQTLGTHGSAILDEVHYKHGDELLMLTATGVRKRNGSALDAIPFGGSSPSNWTVAGSFGEYAGVMYWTDPAGSVDLWKYDGYMQYRAGVPACVGTSADVGTGTWYRIALMFIDLQGNIHWGDYQQLDDRPNSVTITVNTNNGTQFWAKHGLSDAVQTMLHGTDNTFVILTGHNYASGDYIRMANADGVFRVVRITTSAATLLTLDLSPYPGESFSYGAGEPVERRLYAVTFSSANATFGYMLDGYNLLTNATATNNITSSSTTTTTPMEDVYDPTDIKGLPPRMKYMCVYNNQLVLANKSNIQNDPTSGTSKYKDTIAWSNLLLGSTVETFAPFDEEIVGRTDEGDITGVFGGQYSLVVMKETQVYFLNGILFGRQFTINSANTNGVGCTYHKSIQEIPGGCAFMTSKGVYTAIGTNQVSELSDAIEPFINSNAWVFDLGACRSVSIPTREALYFFLPASSSANDVLLIWNYYWKNWSYYYGMNCRGGLVAKDDQLYWSDSSMNFKTEQASFADSGVAIDAFWKSQFLDIGAADLKKKVPKLVLISVCSTAWTPYARSYINWVASTAVTSSNMGSAGPTAPVVDIPLAMAKAYSVQVAVGCNTLNQQAVISGIAVGDRLVQTETKADS